MILFKGKYFKEWISGIYSGCTGVRACLISLTKRLSEFGRIFLRITAKKPGFSLQSLTGFPLQSLARPGAFIDEAVPKLQFWNSNLKIRSFARLKA
jgi:hypothetical protein